MTRTKRQSQLRAQHRKGPFSPGKPGALSGRMALDHQEFKGRRVVNPSAVSQLSTHPPPSPLALGNPGLLNGRMALDHQDYKGSRVVSSSIRSSENPEAPKSRNPPPKHASGTAKKIARLQKKLGCDDNILPNLNRPRNLVTSSGGVPHFILERHPFDIKPPTHEFQELSNVIKTLYQMAQNRPTNTMNTKRLGGEMRMIGFRCASDRGKRGGT
ncbi:Ubiquitin carboxyl-terminal hydrolase 7 [Puccinia graminis f. sp. tritici]|uniref:Ubiquitin carboxyl-terminal hydrolase 7 n=1 Tax=Puccinia graminis f. sp. tritici TaxID=56615 RepID=A0A5B0PCM6_PUCGR|nr:Ubiquitin carboxyl-terminal hydrolase 7 [Puccinia graminis f. sp. tritici]